MNRAKRPCSPIEEVDEMSSTTTELKSEVVLAGDPGYETARHDWNRLSISGMVPSKRKGPMISADYLRPW